MVFRCRNEKCERSFSTISNRNKHERLKNHGPQSEDKIEIPFFNDAFHCRIDGCDTKSNYKHNILKHLKKCIDLKMKRSIVVNNKACPICSKVFAQKSNRERHFKNVHSQQDSADGIDNVPDEFDNDDNEQEQQNQTLPSMVFSIETIQQKVPQSLPTINDTNPEEEEQLE